MKNLLTIIALCFTTALSAQHAHDNSKMQTSMKQNPAKQSEPLKEDGIDPICKMKVSKGEKRTSTYKGKQIGFCSDYCKDKFLENPDKYIKQ